MREFKVSGIADRVRVFGELREPTTYFARTAVVVILTVCAALSSVAAQETRSLGQASTILANGQMLLTGGVDSRSIPSAEAFIVTPDGKRTEIAQRMQVARSGHSATMLPDGTVFIFGGVGADGKIVKTAERFDPPTETFSAVPDVFAVPRAFHTATVLTNGTVLFAGGVLQGGEFPDDVQLFDYRSNKALSFHALLSFTREGHSADLLADGTVRISGGTDHFGKQVAVSEIYDPITKRFGFTSDSASATDQLSPFTIAASLPEDGAMDVPIQDPIAIRFTHLVGYPTVNSKTFILIGPDGIEVQTKVTPTANGRLVFVLPETPLQPGSLYTLRIRGCADALAEALPESSITFQTAGAPPDSAGPDFVPGPGWITGTGGSKWQELPALQAAPGITAVAGQVLKLNGWPLEHVTLEIDGQRARTDATGRFLLKGLVPGHHVLWIDATTANHAGATYGTYEVGVTVLANKTNVLNYTIWMTRLDMAHAMNIPSPTTQETILTNPSLPGLELHLPPNTTITDRKGKVVRQISITPVPLDKPPFPLPAGVEVPIYFTVQPGGAYIKVASSSNGPKGARLIYPNGFNFRPGTPFDFWNYDADARGWYIYGSGRVSDDGRNVIPDPGVVIYEFTGAMTGNTSTEPSEAPPDGPTTTASDPVNLSTGQFIYTKTDLALPDTIPITFSRTYITNDSRSRAFGIGATDSYDFFMVGNTFPYTFQELIKPDGGRVRFDRISAGTDYINSVYVASTSAGPFYGAVLTWNSDPSLPGTWKISMKDGTILSFPEAPNFTNPFCQAVLQIRDRYGNTTKIDRSSQCTLTKITSPNGRYITVSNDSQNRITDLADNSGRTVHYTYDTAGRLSTATDVGGGVTIYTYDDQNRMLTIKDARGIIYLTNQYDGAGRVSQQTEIDGGVYLFNWTPAQTSQTHFLAMVGATDSGGAGGTIFRDACWGSGGFSRYDPNCETGYMPLVAQVDVTDPRGYVERVVFGPTGYKTSDTRALGQPEQQTITYNYYSDNLLKSVTDALGRVTSFDYDGLGNVTRITRLDGTPDAVTSTFAYAGPFGQLSSATDPLNHTSNFAYDGNGNLTTATDALNHPTSFAYNGDGQVSSITDALNNMVQFGYSGGDLASVIDPLGNMSSQFTDGAGRTILSIDPGGNTSLYQYSPLNLVTQVTDAKGNNTTFSYDPNGNLVSLTDALHLTTPTTWTYDNMDRVQTRTDPLRRGESYSYDLNGNLVSSTDRKSQVTSLTYDPLNRLKLVGYNTVVNAGVTSYESTVSYTYDAGNRMTQAVDSAGGTITEAYDNLDRLTSETTPQGQISYGYDLAGRRTSMTVAGQPQVTYTYDNANRLTQIAQGSSTVGFSYDTLNRRSTLTLSNGVNMAYTYDNGSRVTGITYKFNANTLGNLTYSYDSLGRRTQAGGSFAQTGFPTAVTSATYDAANELTNWNGTELSYDLNGNMLSDGTNTFSWNARNQVATLNSVSLQYDAAGRRTKNAAGTSLLYDGDNIVQELSGSAVFANLLSGTVDEMFTRADSNGSFTPLTDGLGSTIAIVDASGNVRTSYSYDPFGATSVSGAASLNVFQYTGRDNEGNGVYFYRARYYSSLLGRFISEDPLGFDGGDVNLYAYVTGDPINLTDPFGLKPGDKYDNIDCAGLDALMDIKERTKRTKHEWAGVMYQYPDGKYSYTDAMEGSASDSNPGQAPPGTKQAGIYHSHGVYDPGFKNEVFSRGDKSGVEIMNYKGSSTELEYALQHPLSGVGYLITPSGKMKKYTPRLPVIVDHPHGTTTILTKQKCGCK
jgi:RHS repeat-associated protein